MKLFKLYFLTCFTFCQAAIAADRAEQKLQLSGSSTISPLAQELGRLYEKSHPQSRIDVQSGGSSKGVLDARQGLADIGMVSRDLKADEQDLKAYPIAKDGIAILVHAKNPIQGISKAQLTAIYKGEIKQWSELGGNKEPITVISKAEGRSTLELFLQYLSLSVSQIKPQVIIGDNEQAIKMLSSNPQAIAYVSIGTAEYHHSQGLGIKLLPLEGVTASTENVLNGKYPLTRTLNLVTNKAPLKPLAKAFLDYIQTPEAKVAIKELYFVPLTQAR